MNKGNKRKWAPATREEIAAAEANLTRDKDQLEQAKSQFDQFSTELQDNFANGIESLLSDEERTQVEDGSIKDKWNILQSKYQNEVQNKIEAGREKLNALEDQLIVKTTALENRKLDLKIAEDNPDLDLEAFGEWTQNDISPRLLQEITEAAGGDGQKFAELLVAKYKEIVENAGKDGSNKGKEDKCKKSKKEMPKDLSDVPGESGDIDNGDGGSDTDDDFLSQSGVYR